VQPREVRRCAGDDGTALVEAAFITPVFIYFVFGLLEFGLLFARYQALSNMTVYGARSAAINGKSDTADYYILQAIKNAHGFANVNDITRVVVWHAQTAYSTISAGCLAGTGSSASGAECNIYTPTSFTLPITDFNYSVDGTAPDQNWPGSTRKDANIWPAGADFVGVTVVYNHKWLTGLFGSNKQLINTSVFRIEPHSVN
jgi:hypothetical protein